MKSMVWFSIILISTLGCEKDPRVNTSLASATSATVFTATKGNFLPHNFALFSDDAYEISFRPDGSLFRPTSEIAVDIIIKSNTNKPVNLSYFKTLMLCAKTADYNEECVNLLTQDASSRFSKLRDNEIIFKAGPFFGTGVNSKDTIPVGSHTMIVKLIYNVTILEEVTRTYPIQVVTHFGH